jgi:hypothetical protein
VDVPIAREALQELKQIISIFCKNDKNQGLNNLDVGFIVLLLPEYAL